VACAWRQKRATAGMPRLAARTAARRRRATNVDKKRIARKINAGGQRRGCSWADCRRRASAHSTASTAAHATQYRGRMIVVWWTKIGWQTRCVDDGIMRPASTPLRLWRRLACLLPGIPTPRGTAPNATHNIVFVCGWLHGYRIAWLAFIFPRRRVRVARHSDGGSHRYQQQAADTSWRCRRRSTVRRRVALTSARGVAST